MFRSWWAVSFSVIHVMYCLIMSGCEFHRDWRCSLNHAYKQEKIMTMTLTTTVTVTVTITPTVTVTPITIIVIVTITLMITITLKITLTITIIIMRFHFSYVLNDQNYDRIWKLRFLPRALYRWPLRTPGPLLWPWRVEYSRNAPSCPMNIHTVPGSMHCNPDIKWCEIK